MVKFVFIGCPLEAGTLHYRLPSLVAHWKLVLFTIDYFFGLQSDILILCLDTVYFCVLKFRVPCEIPITAHHYDLG